jgi:hypothetical protein
MASERANLEFALQINRLFRQGWEFHQQGHYQEAIVSVSGAVVGSGQEGGEVGDGIGNACHRYTPSFSGDRRRNRDTYTSSWPGSHRIMLLRSVSAGDATRARKRV